MRQLTASMGSNLEAGYYAAGDRYVDVLSVSRLPEYTETGYLRSITEDLHGTYYVVVQAQRESDYDVSNELEKKKNDLWTRVRSPGVIPNGKAVNLLEQIELAQRLEGLESRFKAAVSVVLIAGTKDELDTMKRKARAICRAYTRACRSPTASRPRRSISLLPHSPGAGGFQFSPYTSNVIDIFPRSPPGRALTRAPSPTRTATSP